MPKIRTCTYSVSGTHCCSCELIIESEVKKVPGVTSVSASTKNQQVVIEYHRQPPKVSLLNNLFKEYGYIFSPLSKEGVGGGLGFKPDIFISLLISVLIILIFYFIQKLGIYSSFSVNSDSVTPAFFISGLLAGFSTCAALVGGIVLSLSRRGLPSVISFNLGRIILFTIFGAILGYFGSFFRLSVTTLSVITIIVSLVMLVTALQFLNFKFLNFLSFALPKSITSKIISSPQSSFILGGLTFFLPCGFTLTTQSLALASGSWSTGALIMLFFALGTFIPLMIIGLTGSKSINHPKFSGYFSQIIGLLLIVFALFNLKSQFNIIGYGVGASFTEARPNVTETVNGVQILKMTASSSGYSPDTFTVKAGQPVRWEITDRGTSGCTNAVVSRTLFTGPINLVTGTTSVKEFTAPTTPGTYRFSCWMGMISGTINVVN